MSSDDALSRQTRLAEVGIEGQARIAALSAEVGHGPGATEEALYLERAGVVAVRRTPDAPTPEFKHGNAFHFAPSRDIAAGAWRALRQLRGALDMSDRR